MFPYSSETRLVEAAGLSCWTYAWETPGQKEERGHSPASLLPQGGSPCGD